MKELSNKSLEYFGYTRVEPPKDTSTYYLFVPKTGTLYHDGSGPIKFVGKDEAEKQAKKLSMEFGEKYVLLRATAEVEMPKPAPVVRYL